MSGAEEGKRGEVGGRVGGGQAPIALSWLKGTLATHATGRVDNIVVH